MLMVFLAPLAEGQRAIVIGLCLLCVHASVCTMRVSVNFFFKELLRNCGLDNYQISQECSLAGPFSNSFKYLCSMKNSGCHGNQSKKSSLSKPQLDSIIILQECSLDGGLQNSLKKIIHQKTWLLWETHFPFIMV